MNWPAYQWWYMLPEFRDYAGLNDRSATDYNVPLGMVCPMATRSIEARDPYGRAPIQKSYGYCTNFNSNPSLWVYDHIKWRITRIARPADKIEFSDACDTFISAVGSSPNYYPVYGEQSWTSTVPVNMVAYRHDKWKANVCFWDGHAEPKDMKEIGVLDNGSGTLVAADSVQPVLQPVLARRPTLSGPD